MKFGEICFFFLLLLGSVEAKKKVADPVGDACDEKSYESKLDPIHPKYVLACVDKHVVRLSANPPKAVEPVAVNEIAMVSGSCGSVPVPETPEHFLERKNCVVYETNMNQDAKEINALRRRIDAGFASHQLADVILARKLVDANYKLYFESMEKRNLSLRRLGSVDDCAVVYNTTSELKVSDLTVKQSDAIAYCKSLKLYPPTK